MLHIFSNKIYDWFVAETQQEAAKMVQEYHECQDNEIDTDFEQVDDSQMLDFKDEENNPVKITAKELSELCGKGFVGRF